MPIVPRLRSHQQQCHSRARAGTGFAILHPHCSQRAKRDNTVLENTPKLADSKLKYDNEESLIKSGSFKPNKRSQFSGLLSSLVHQIVSFQPHFGFVVCAVPIPLGKGPPAAPKLLRVLEKFSLEK